MGETIVLCAANEVLEGEIKQAPLPDGSTSRSIGSTERYMRPPTCAPMAKHRLSEEGIMTGKIVECTFHFGTFDVTTGEPTGMPCEIPLKTYPVTIVDGNVQIEV